MSRIVRSRAHEHVIVQVGFAMTIDAVGKSHHAFPTSLFVTDVATVLKACYDAALIKVLNGRGHRVTMRSNNIALLFVRAHGQQNRDWSRSRDHEVETNHAGSLGGTQHVFDVAFIRPVPRSTDPPPGVALSHAT
jgi:hypothetical protein